jgi:hypothetical protein
MSDDTRKFVSDYPIQRYKCGLCAGDRLRLKRDLPIADHKNVPTGKIHPAGEVWTVLPGAAEPPVDVWLRQPDGESHTWDDDAQIFDWFENVD